MSKNLANFRASAALVKQGLARQVGVGVYRHIPMYKHVCTAFPRSFEAMLSAKLPGKTQSRKGMRSIRASGSGPGAGGRPLARHFQAYFQAYFQLTGREPEQNPSWYLPATAPRQCQAGTGHRHLLLPARAATTNQQGPEFWAPAQIPALAQLQFPSLISCLKSPGQSMGAGTEGLLAGGREAAFRLHSCATRWYRWLSH